jgi:hypothetical protein
MCLDAKFFLFRQKVFNGKKEEEKKLLCFKLENFCFAT